MPLSSTQLSTLFNNLLLNTTLLKSAAKGEMPDLNELLKQGIWGDDLKNVVETLAKSLFLNTKITPDNQGLALLKQLVKLLRPLAKEIPPQQLPQLKQDLQGGLKQLIAHFLTTNQPAAAKTPHTVYAHNQLLRSPELLQNIATDIEETKSKADKEQELFGLGENKSQKKQRRRSKNECPSDGETLQLIRALMAIRSALDATLKALLAFQQKNDDATLKRLIPDFDERVSLLREMLKECTTILQSVRFVN